MAEKKIVTRLRNSPKKSNNNADSLSCNDIGGCRQSVGVGGRIQDTMWHHLNVLRGSKLGRVCACFAQSSFEDLQLGVPVIKHLSRHSTNTSPENINIKTKCVIKVVGGGRGGGGEEDDDEMQRVPRETRKRSGRSSAASTDLTLSTQIGCGICVGREFFFRHARGQCADA